MTKSKETTNPNETPLLNNTTYDFFKRAVELGLPGVGALYFALASLWDLPYGEEIVGTCAAIAVFLGVILTVSRSSYKKTSVDKDGVIVVDHTDPMKDNYTFEMNIPFDELDEKDVVTLKVNNPSSQ